MGRNHHAAYGIPCAESNPRSAIVNNAVYRRDTRGNTRQTAPSGIKIMEALTSIITPIIISIIVGLCATIAALIGWIGSRINVRLEKIGDTLAAIERDLRGELYGLDRRVTRLEANTNAHEARSNDD